MDGLQLLPLLQRKRGRSQASPFNLKRENGLDGLHILPHVRLEGTGSSLSRA
jgi:hypothetical protein